MKKPKPQRSLKRGTEEQTIEKSERTSKQKVLMRIIIMQLTSLESPIPYKSAIDKPGTYLRVFQ